ncbi:MAG TPA: cytochrome c-type biogenesis protein [Steroidobacteraceae bacterium]|nr:cytochrome c-type biogenesis protein [Steroidobacteraceae bacterium]
MRTLLGALLLCLVVCAHAIDTAPAFADPVLQERYDSLNHRLRCLQCRSETIADSNATLAGDLRKQVKDLIAAGRTDDEILQFMTNRYSDYVLYDPPVAPRTWLLWAAPVLLLIGAVIGAVVVIIRKSRLPDTDPADPGLGTS